MKVTAAGYPGRWRNGSLRIDDAAAAWKPWAFSFRRKSVVVPIDKLSLTGTRRLRRVEALYTNAGGRVLLLAQESSRWQLALMPRDIGLLGAAVHHPSDRRWSLLARLAPLFGVARGESEEAVYAVFAKMGVAAPAGYMDFITTIGYGSFRAHDMGWSVWPISSLQAGRVGLPPAVVPIGAVGAAGGRFSGPAPDGLIALDLRDGEPRMLELPIPVDITQRKDLHCEDLPQYVMRVLRLWEEFMVWRAVQLGRLSDARAWFTFLPAADQRDVIGLVTRMARRAGWREDDSQTALNLAAASAGQIYEPTRASRVVATLFRGDDLTRSSTNGDELFDVFWLLLHTLIVADTRMKAEACGFSCDHWWHEDLDQPGVLRRLSYEPDADESH